MKILFLMLNEAINISGIHSYCSIPTFKNKNDARQSFSTLTINNGSLKKCFPDNYFSTSVDGSVVTLKFTHDECKVYDFAAGFIKYNSMTASKGFI